MKTLYLLCGMPFSGKTTLGKSIAQQADENVVRYSVNQSIDEWIAKHFVTNLD
ncbi:MAG: AAA family ATPase [Pleurocapsa sp. CRU_1_2]|nr:AAA family ATPase [Pleurocapsa sp. CRU_1_2]